MAQPIFSVNDSFVIGIAEFENYLIIGNQVYDKANLTKPNIYSVASFKRTNNPWDTGGTYTYYAGSQIALGNQQHARGYLGSITLNPNLRNDVSSVLDFGSNALIGGYGKAGFYSVRFNLTSFTTSSYKVDNYYHLDTYIPIGNDEYLGISPNSYYDRFYFAFKRKITESEYTEIHSSKTYHNYCNGGFLEKTPTAVYMYTSYDSNYFEVIKYDVNSQAITSLKKINFGNKQTTIPSQFHPTASDDTTKLFYTVRNNGNNVVRIDLWTLDISAGTCTNQELTPDNTGLDFYYDVNDSKSGLASFIVKDGDNLYLCAYFYNRFDISPNINNAKIYVWQIDPSDPTKLTFVNQYDFNQYVGGIIFLSSDRTKIAIAGSSDAIAGTFKDGEWTFTQIGIGQVKFMLYDTYGRLWIVNNSNSVFMELPTVPAKAVIRWEKDEYNYFGSDISTKVYVSTYNYQGERVAVTGQLKILTENAEFTDGSKVKNITTSATGDVAVDIVIKGSGAAKVAFDYSYGT